MRARSGTARPNAGFTLLETMVVLGVLGVLGYSMAITVEAGRDSQLAVMDSIAEGRTLRTTSSTLINELRSTSADTMTVTELPDGNHQLDFQLPIEVDGTASWGIHDPRQDVEEELQNKEGWSLRYTVIPEAQPDGSTVRTLWRQLLDEGGVIQRARRLTTRLCSGTNDPPGFRVVQQGDVWVITLSTEGRAEGSTLTKAEFHVRTRN